MFHFCKHKDIFGKPNEGVHKYKIMNIAIVDVLGTILIAKEGNTILYNTRIRYMVNIVLLFYFGNNNA